MVFSVPLCLRGWIVFRSYMPSGSVTLAKDSKTLRGRPRSPRDTGKPQWFFQGLFASVVEYFSDPPCLRVCHACQRRRDPEGMTTEAPRHWEATMVFSVPL